MTPPAIAPSTARMRRPTVTPAFTERGPGGAPLTDALDRAPRAKIAAPAPRVEAKDERAAGFYRRHGVVALPDFPLTPLLPLTAPQRLTGKEMRESMRNKPAKSTQHATGLHPAEGTPT